MSTVDDLRAWRRLPRATRKEVRRHLDLQYARIDQPTLRIAYAWSRAAMRLQSRVIVTFITLALACFAAIGITFWIKGDGWQPPILFMIGLFALPILFFGTASFTLLPAFRRLPSALHLLVNTGPAGKPQALRVVGKSRRTASAAEVILLIGMVAGWIWALWYEFSWYRLALGFLVPFGIHGYLYGDDGVLVRPPARRVALLVDSRGVWVAQFGVLLKWTDIRAVGTRPEPAADKELAPPRQRLREPVIVKICFSLADPDAIRSRAHPANQRYRDSLHRMLAEHSALVFPAHWFRADAELILSTAHAYLKAQPPADSGTRTSESS